MPDSDGPDAPSDHEREPPGPPSAAGPVAFDSPAEVDAVFRTQRRVSVGYALLSTLVLVSVSVFAVALDWWTTGRIIGGISPGFAMAAFGLYVVFVALTTAASTLASTIERRMLSGADELWRDAWEPSTGDAPPAPPASGHGEDDLDGRGP